MNKENHLVEYKRELSETFERSVIAFLNSTGGHVYIPVPILSLSKTTYSASCSR